MVGGLTNPDYSAFNFGGVPLAQGTQYALALRVMTPSDPCANAGPNCTPPEYRADEAFASDFYPAGSLFSGVAAVPNAQLRADLTFQTLMSAIPEANAWLATLLGIGMWTIGTLRRLRR